MTTLLEMRDRVRDFVKDNNPDVSRRKVSDAELTVYLKDALNEYSYRFPLRSVADNAAAASIAPPTDMVPGEGSVNQVQVGSNLWSQWTIAEGESLPTSGKFWYWRGGTITFASTPTTTISVWYGAVWPFPATDGAAFTLPAADEELLVLYGAIKFHQKLGTVAAKLDRFKERGERDDSPLVMMHEVLLKQYEQLVASRRPHGSVRIRKGSEV